LVVSLALGVPPGLAATVGNYDVVQLTDNLGQDYFPTLNNLGQIVWTWNYIDDTSYEFYDGTKITALNASRAKPMLLNNQGQMAYEGYNFEIYFSSDGSAFTQIATTYNGIGNGLQLNDQGQMVWSDYDGTNWTICFFTNPGESHFADPDPTTEVDSPCLNNQGQVVWREVEGNTQELWLYDGSQVSSFYQATNKGLSHLQINDQGQIVWQESDSSGYCHIMLYDKGALRLEVDLQRRLKERGAEVSWFDLMRDLKQVQSVLIELDGQRDQLRTDLVGAAHQAFAAAGVRSPSTVMPLGPVA